MALKIKPDVVTPLQPFSPLWYDVPMNHVFISYSSGDAMFADQLATNLKIAEIATWYAPWEIRVGDSIIRKIQEGISAADYLIVILSPESVKSLWVREELEAGMVIAIERGAFVLPVLLAQCTLPLFLRHRRYLDFRKDEREAFNELARRIKPEIRHCQWYGASQALAYSLLMTIFESALAELRKDTASFPANARKRLGDKLRGQAKAAGISDDASEYYVTMCIEFGALLDTHGFIRHVPEFIQRHPDSEEDLLKALESLVRLNSFPNQLPSQGE